MKIMLAEYKQGGPSFFIPVDVNDNGELFTKDVVPVEDEQFEDKITEQEKADAWAEFEYEMQMMDRKNNF